jgi:predicted alpha/beta-fold hydrolase
MVLCKYLITYPKEAAEVFEAALIISIAWDCNAGAANLETNLINRYVINKVLTESLVKLAKK